MEWRPAGWSVCLPLLISPCTTKSRSSLLALAHPDGPGKRAVKRLWCGDSSFTYELLQWLIAISIDIGVIIIIRLHCGTSSMWPIATRGEVCSVGLSVATTSPTKMPEPIKLPFRIWTWVGWWNHVLHGGPDYMCEVAFLREKGGSPKCCEI